MPFSSLEYAGVVSSVFDFARSVSGISEIDVVPVMMPLGSGTSVWLNTHHQDVGAGNGVSRSRSGLSMVGTRL